MFVYDGKIIYKDFKLVFSHGTINGINATQARLIKTQPTNFSIRDMFILRQLLIPILSDIKFMTEKRLPNIFGLNSEFSVGVVNSEDDSNTVVEMLYFGVSDRELVNINKFIIESGLTFMLPFPPYEVMEMVIVAIIQAYNNVETLFNNATNSDISPVMYQNASIILNQMIGAQGNPVQVIGAHGNPVQMIQAV